MTRENFIPRIQAKVGQIEDPPEFKDKWAFSIWVSSLGGATGNDEPLKTIGPFDTKDEAHAEMQKAVRLVCEIAEKELTGKTSGAYIDMKTNMRIPWDKQ